MHDHEFAEQMARLIDTYGVRAFPQERSKLIYNVVIGFDANWLADLISQLIGSMRQPPMVPDFREAAQKERRRKFDFELAGAADKWKLGEFHGLPRYLASIGAKSLTDAMEREKQKFRKEKNERS